jgi:hypothetical protein
LAANVVLREYFETGLEYTLTSDDLLKTLRKPMVDAGLPAQLAINLTNNIIKKVCVSIRMQFKKILQQWCMVILKTHRNANDFGVGFLKQIAKALAHGS